MFNLWSESICFLWGTECEKKNAEYKKMGNLGSVPNLNNIK